MPGSPPNTSYLDFLIELDRRDKLIKSEGAKAPCVPAGPVTEYTVAITVRMPDSQADSQRVGLARFDWRKLVPEKMAGKPPVFDSLVYGRWLADALFNDEVVKNTFAIARGSAESPPSPTNADNADIIPMRLRLAISPDACELHNLYWETLADPLDKSVLLPLSASERVLFSRYLVSPDMRPVRMRARERLRALVVVARPTNLADFKLEPAPAEELDDIVKALGAIPATRLPVEVQTASLSNLVDTLRKQPADILFLECHGVLEKDEPYLYLEDQAGQVKLEKGVDLVENLRDLPSRPRLVVLVSCGSAAGPGANMLTALGPRLVEAGIPAVIAMHGSISMTTASGMMPVFFNELQTDGQIDRALAIARRKFKDRPDASMPVLFMRLRDGLIWYETAFIGPDGVPVDSPDWSEIIYNINNDRCTPILGPGVYEWLTGSESELTRLLAEKADIALGHQFVSLPQLSQFLAVLHGNGPAREKLTDLVKEQIHTVHGHSLPEGYDYSTATLDDLVTTVGSVRRQSTLPELNQLIAEMPFRMVLTANPGTLLADAFRETLAPPGPGGAVAVNKDPQVLICPWNETVQKRLELHQPEERYTPSIARPLVYHFFGRLDPPRSMVLSEDDYFNLLINVSSNKDLIPKAVKEALINKSLLFIGFQMEDWNFRVLMRYILSIPGAASLSERIHFAVQLKPDPDRIIDPARAYQYLQRFPSREGVSFSIFWGSAEDFVRQLYDHWKASR